MIYKEKFVVDENHPLWWLEKVVKAGDPWNGNHNEEHAIEHGEMLDKWGCSRETCLLTPPDAQTSRCYHLVLHLKYWKEMGLHNEYVEKFEKEIGDNLEDVPVPQKIVPGSGVY